MARYRGARLWRGLLEIPVATPCSVPPPAVVLTQSPRVMQTKVVSLMGKIKRETNREYP